MLPAAYPPGHFVIVTIASYACTHLVAAARYHAVSISLFLRFKRVAQLSQI